MSAAHPFEHRQVPAGAPEFRVAMEAPHRLVSLPPILEPYELGRPEGSPHPAQYLRGLKPEPSQRGHSSSSCRKHSASSGDSCAERAKLNSAIGVLSLWSRPRGVGSTAGAIISCFDTFILAHCTCIV